MSQVNIAVSTQTGAAEGNLTKLESKIEALEAAMKDTGIASVKAARDAEGSFNQLEKELKQNEAALRKLTIGSKEFDAQKVKVDNLRKSLAGAKGELQGVALNSQPSDRLARTLLMTSRACNAVHDCANRRAGHLLRA